MSQHFDVIIVGGGIIGFSAAVAMRQRGFSVVVLDAGNLAIDAVVKGLRVYALNQASQSLLTQLGVWPLVDKTQVSLYEHMRVWDAQNGAKLEFDARMVGQASLGVIVEESVLKQALLQRALALGVVLCSAVSVERVQPSDDAIRIYDANHLCWTGDLLMIADGANSVTRASLGVSLSRYSYHQTAIVATVSVEKSHQKTAYQVFHADGPLAFLPLADPHQCSIVWSIETERAKALMNDDPIAFALKLTQAFEHTLGQVSCLSDRIQFPLWMQHAAQYHGQRWILMGDSAHTIHPLAGLGLNVGLADLAVWMERLDQTSAPIWSKKLLGGYQRQRKSDVWQVIALMGGLKTGFGYTSQPLVALRGLGLNVLNRSSILKQFLIQHACGC